MVLICPRYIFTVTCREKAKRTVTAVWNPFTKIIEPLRCELSGEPVYDFYLDDLDAKNYLTDLLEGEIEVILDADDCAPCPHHRVLVAVAQGIAPFEHQCHLLLAIPLGNTSRAETINNEIDELMLIS